MLEMGTSGLMSGAGKRDGASASALAPSLDSTNRGQVQGPVSFHRDDAVRDDEVHRYCRADIEDASVDALPMQDVLRPPVLRARDHAEHILHTQRDASPVV